MLVVTRKDGESLVIIDRQTGAHAKITLVRTKPHTAKIGVEAPPEWLVLRDELIERSGGVADGRSQRGVRPDRADKAGAD